MSYPSGTPHDNLNIQIHSRAFYFRWLITSESHVRRAQRKAQTPLSLRDHFGDMFVFRFNARLGNGATLL